MSDGTRWPSDILRTMKVLIAAGTRPEAIKLAPLGAELRRRPDQFDVRFCSTGQHREMLDQVLRLFHLNSDIDLDVMTPNQQLGDLTASVLQRMSAVLRTERPDWVVVQGYTTTTMATALAAFYQKLPVAHVEAGLRSGDRFHPYPEEWNRKATDAASDLLFAPTEQAAANLRAEGYGAEQIFVTGNTGIDALLQVASRADTPFVRALVSAHAGTRLVLVTTHRRENFGSPLSGICDGLLSLAQRVPDVQFVLPVHRNPNVAEVVHERLGGNPRFTLTAPLDYADFVGVMKHASLILTDSGGVQEEAPSLGVPVLVLREKTERQEAVEAGTARLVGTDAAVIADTAHRLLTDAAERQRMIGARNPFGDGQASARIANALFAHRPVAR